MQRNIREVEDYTLAFLVTAGVTLFMALLTLAAVKGFAWVLVAAAALDGLIRLLAPRAGDLREGR